MAHHEELETIVKDLRTELEDVRAGKIAEHRAEKYKLQAEITELRRQLAEQQQQQQSAAHSIGEATTPVSAVHGGTAAHSKLNAHLRDDDDTSEFLNTLVDEKVKLQAELDELRKNMDAQIVQLVEATKEQMKQQIVQQIRQVVLNLQSDFSSLSERYKYVMEEMADLKQDNIRLVSENRDLTERIAGEIEKSAIAAAERRERAQEQQRAQTEAVHMKLAELERKLEQTRRLLEDERAARNRLERTKKQQQADIERLERLHNDELRKRGNFEVERVTQLQQTIEQLDAALRIAQQESTRETEKLKLLRIDDKQRIKRLETSNGDLDLNNKRLTAENRRLTEALSKSEQVRGSNSAQNSRTTATSAGGQDEDKLRQSQRELSNDKIKLELELKNLKEDLESVRSELESTKERGRTQIARLKQQHSQEVANLNKELETSNKEKVDLRKQIRDLGRAQRR